MFQDIVFAVSLILMAGAVSHVRAAELVECAKNDCAITVYLPPPDKQFFVKPDKSTFSTAGKRVHHCDYQKGVYSDACPFIK